jgi:PAS domain-containing protein
MLGLASFGGIRIASHHGFAPPAGSPCTQAILAPGPLFLCDAAAEIVPGARFYAGVPLILDGVTHGALAVRDTRPRRRLRDSLLAALRDLAVLAAQELGRRVPAPEPLLEFRGGAADDDPGSSALVWATDPEGYCTLVSRFHLDSSPAGITRPGAIVHECRTRRSGGRDRWVLQQAAPRFSPHGRFAGYVGICLDTTARKLAERALRQTREWPDLGQQATGIGFWNFDIVRDNCRCTGQYFRL